MCENAGPAMIPALNRRGLAWLVSFKELIAGNLLCCRNAWTTGLQMTIRFA